MTEIDAQTKLLGIIGWPVEHSLSPTMHNAAFAALGLNWVYLPLPVPPGQVEAALRGLLTLGFRGANVTVPHKEAVMPHLDSITEVAQAIGAVNTLVVGEGRLVGDNTDGAGFLAALQEAGFEPRGRRALVLGAGGAARAVAYALATAGAQVTVLNRTLSRTEALIQHLAPAVPPNSLSPRLLDRDALVEEAVRADLLVNATSVGMWPDAEHSPWPDELPLPSHLTVFDLVYNPPETRLLRQARRAGAQAIGGLGMLVHQGALAFRLWTGHSPPLEAMWTACERALTAGEAQNCPDAGSVV
ncbi:MAG: shikimate dehydrogenase [Anaerolineae bacterium]|nr:shikimate dehydrogenase [Anaerolineae bacterium]